jgi:hypothetical protein
LAAATSKQAVPVDKKQYQNDDHKDRQYRDNSSTATPAAIVVSHDGTPSLKATIRLGAIGGSQGRLLSQALSSVKFDGVKEEISLRDGLVLLALLGRV